MAKPTTHELPLEPKYDHYDFPTTSITAQSGHPGHTTPEQDAKVFQLRTMLEQAGCKDRLDTLTMVRIHGIPQPFQSTLPFTERIEMRYIDLHDA